jgi:hypothetical protein
VPNYNPMKLKLKLTSNAYRIVRTRKEKVVSYSRWNRGGARKLH